MEHPPTATNSIFISPPDPAPPFPPSSRSVDLSPLEFILGIIAIIAIPALIYTFFFSIRCPPSLFGSGRNSSSDDAASTAPSIETPPPPPPPQKQAAVADLKYKKETHGNDVGTECPVCLSVFSDGEQVKQLSVCNHSFHSTCIDLWLNSHSNCPVCRANVGPKKPATPTTRNNNPRNDDLHQGLPDASTLV